MKKISSILLILSICVFLLSCRHKETYKLMHPQEDISSICIVLLSFDDEGKMAEKELSLVESKEEFMNSFRDVDCFTYFGDPIGPAADLVDDTVVKITYTNGEYELINWLGQASYTTKYGFRFYDGFNVFDKAQFESLISEYTQAN